MKIADRGQFRCPLCGTNIFIEEIQERSGHFQDHVMLSVFRFKCYDCDILIQSRFWPADELKEIIEKEYKTLKNKILSLQVKL